MKKFTFGKFAKETLKNKQKGKSEQAKVLSDKETDNLLTKSLDYDDAMAGRAIYEKIYGQTQLQIARLWKGIFGLVIALIFAIIWLGVLGNASKVDLAVVHENGNNQIISIDRASQLDHHVAYPEMITYLLQQFLYHSRTVSVDGILEADMMRQSLAFTQGQATKALITFFNARNPEELSKTNFIEVVINKSIPNIGGSDKTTQMSWTEIKKDNATNQIISKRHYTALFTYRLELKPPKYEQIMRYNPLGFYITHINWAEDYQTDSNT
jgi:type IV secretory pathway TrbF-like protein